MAEASERGRSFQFRPAPSKTTSTPSPPASDSFCARCMSIDFEQIFKLRISSAVGEHVIDLDENVINLDPTADELRAAGCGLCLLLGSASRWPLEYSNRTCHLRAFSAKTTFVGLTTRKLDFIPGTIILGVISLKKNGPRYITRDNYQSMRPLLESGYLSLVKAPEDLTPFDFRLFDPKLFDFGFANTCIKHCRTFHGAPARQKTIPP
jgi:hypothetical protein